jgi:hypothetical protein
VKVNGRPASAGAAHLFAELTSPVLPSYVLVCGGDVLDCLPCMRACVAVDDMDRLVCYVCILW